MTQNSQTWLITGGSSGIGFALAKAVSAQGHKVIVCGRDEARLELASREIPNLITRRCDIAEQTSRLALVDWIEVAHPELNVLVNNAGLQNRRDLLGESSAHGLDAEIATNLTAPIDLTLRLLRLLRLQPGATIINVTSGLAFVPRVDLPVYCATKAGLHSFTLSLRHQLGQSDMRVVEMAPPIVATGLGRQTRSERGTGVAVLTPDEYVAQALDQFEQGHDEILVGVAIALRREGEALLGRLNR